MRDTIITQNLRRQARPKAAQTPEATVSYGHYLLMLAQTAGNMSFDGHAPSEEEQSIGVKLRALCKEIEGMMTVVTASELALLLDIYDMAYTVGFHKMPDPNLLARCKNRIIAAWKSGKEAVEESTVFGIMAGMVRYNAASADRTVKETYESILKDWLLTLLRHDDFPRVTTYERYQRLALLMGLNLYQYLGADAESVKQEWYEAHKIDDLKTESSEILKSYRRFITSLPASVLPYPERRKIEKAILTELSTRPDLHPYDREAYRLGGRF